MGKNTSVSLGDHFEDFVESRISKGRYKNASEVIRAGLRLLEDEENKLTSLKKAIKEGIDSGVAHNFDSEKHLALIKTAKKRNG
ncbi:MAG TPA: type II toxin-antitoxin system ParD family antitoxin [Cyclobacteriaceae bacterium]|jgi:antitoxin ParD1/3/4|nr:type II toxin-antitoxin system ParD family antitoxin [Cytophagales bacterium]HMR56850.1 type II toxin-antitoxin system ParD family antitoxin [Cyclobacteriaceae bacterium]HNT50488.1 type II toxin-antitoxin system ParD family antitoxin [Cyclobacteriaceae bacterium]HRE68088.1 type II toxin-antitoxin system ParD family antitoxin [Cyclobacteriaceae bacterium]HRF35081.1 type II toxin-antitoxin system ParD family antitoxin [Cyclobacteriaceae bacterium]